MTKEYLNILKCLKQFLKVTFIHFKYFLCQNNVCFNYSNEEGNFHFKKTYLIIQKISKQSIYKHNTTPNNIMKNTKNVN